MTKDWVPPKRRNPVVSSGAGGGTRTHMELPPADFESATSTIPSHRPILRSSAVGENFREELGKKLLL